MNRSVRAAIGASLGMALALSLATPASADELADPPDTPALSAWNEGGTTASDALPDTWTVEKPAVDNSTNGVSTRNLTSGKRLVFTRGSALMWSRNTLEWYWTSAKITRSTGWQEVGFVFPNTARAGGISRTYASSTVHNWRGTTIIGAGVVTPWGDVNVYTSSATTYFTLKRGGSYGIR